MNLFSNKFLQAFGVGVFAYIGFKVLGYALLYLAGFLRSFADWYQYSALPYAEGAAFFLAIAYLLAAAVINSK